MLIGDKQLEIENKIKGYYFSQLDKKNLGPLKKVEKWDRFNISRKSVLFRWKNTREFYITSVNMPFAIYLCIF